MWKLNLAKIIINSGFQLIEISAWTNLEMSKLSAIKNKKHSNLTCKEFLLLKQLFKKNHKTFINEIFGDEHFKNIKQIIYTPKLTQTGLLFRQLYSLEILPKKEIIKATTIKSSRIDYILFKDDEGIKIDELTQIEIALGEELGKLCNIRFSYLKLNNHKDYETKMNELKTYNRKANERRKKHM